MTLSNRKQRRFYVQVQSRGEGGLAEEIHFGANGTFRQLQDEVWANLDETDTKCSGAHELKLARPGSSDKGEPTLIRLRNDKHVQQLKHGNVIVLID